jgi:hypothetical protein
MSWLFEINSFFLCIIFSSRLNLWDIIIAFITFKFHLEKDTSPCYVSWLFEINSSGRRGIAKEMVHAHKESKQIY